MRPICTISGWMILLAAGSLWADDEPKGPSGQPPVLVLARAVADDKDGVTLRIRMPIMTAATVAETVNVPVQVETIVDGRKVVETRLVPQVRNRMVWRCSGWGESKVKVDGEVVFVHDLK